MYIEKLEKMFYNHHIFCVVLQGPIRWIHKHIWEKCDSIHQNIPWSFYYCTNFPNFTCRQYGTMVYDAEKLFCRFGFLCGGQQFLKLNNWKCLIFSYFRFWHVTYNPQQYICFKGINTWFAIYLFIIHYNTLYILVSNCYILYVLRFRVP